MDGGTSVNFLIALLILIILVFVGYGLLYYLGRKQTKANIELDERKQEIMAIPVADKLFTLRNKNVTGSTRRIFESEQANWQTITRFKLPEIEAALVTAQADTDKFSLINARQTASKVEDLLSETEVTVKQINQRLADILANESKNEAYHEESYARYAVIRKQLLAHSYRYGESQETLERSLSYIELDFTKYNQLMNEGDFVGASEMLDQVNADIEALEIMMAEIPELLKKIKEEYEEQVHDIKQGYQRMLSEKYQFPLDVDLKTEISIIDSIIDEANHAIASVDLNEARDIMEHAEAQIDKTYDLMEVELISKDYIGKNQGAIQRRMEQVFQSNKYGILEIDRVSQNFLLHENEIGKMQEYADQIEHQRETLEYTNDQLAKHAIAYTEMEKRYQEVYASLADIDKGQSAIVASLADLKHKERDIRDSLDEFDLELRNMKRTIETNLIPGLPDEYLDRFFDASDKVEELDKRLNRVKLDMVDIENISNSLSEDIEYLDTETTNIIDTAKLTESTIQYANRYRQDHPGINQSISRAFKLFQEEYRYADAYQVVRDALDMIEPGASKKVEKLYLEEQNYREF